MHKIGNNIRRHRLMAGYKQRYMGFMLDISQTAYSDIELDQTEITLKRIYEIAEILGVGISDLLFSDKR